MKYYGFVAKFSTQPGEGEALLAILLEAAKALMNNEECKQYLVSQSQADVVWVTEIWTTKAAHDASLEPDDIKALINRAMPLLAGAPELNELDIAGGKGLPS